LISFVVCCRKNADDAYKTQQNVQPQQQPVYTLYYSGIIGLHHRIIWFFRSSSLLVSGTSSFLGVTLLICMILSGILPPPAKLSVRPDVMVFAGSPGVPVFSGCAVFDVLLSLW